MNPTSTMLLRFRLTTALPQKKPTQFKPVKIVLT